MDINNINENSYNNVKLKENNQYNTISTNNHNKEKLDGNI